MPTQVSPQVDTKTPVQTPISSQAQTSTAPRRLLDDFTPKHYTLKLDISRKEKRFQGSVVIEGTSQAPTFKLNQKYLDIASVLVNGTSCSFESSDADETLTIFAPAQTQGELRVEIAYSARLTDTMMGIYPSYYVLDGEKRELIGTQFETTFAREAFPCVDEPMAKATFDLAVKFDEQPGECALSNQPEVACKDGYHIFERTVRMSTYLLAFVCGDLQKKSANTKTGVEVGVFSTRAHDLAELDVALDIAVRAIEFYEDFYQTPYPLAHSYHVALPDFSAGAMENWGLITYRESYMLVDPHNSTITNKQLVATVVAHELAHQWFGDLVTMKWWDNLWLNESFANMMQYVAIDAIEPSWRIWERFQPDEAASALARDAVAGVQSVHVMVEDPREIDSIFDGAIVYAKGARLLVMVRALIGDEALAKGLKAYFDAHKYANAEGKDLWRCLSEASGIDLGDIMESWLEQPGYPMLSARVENDRIILSQKQFFMGKSDGEKRLWHIPLGANYPAAQTIMNTETLDFGSYSAARAQVGKPFMLNDHNTTHMIVHYDKTLLTDILAHKDELSPIDCYKLAQDMLLLARGRVISYAEIVPIMGMLSTHPSYIVSHKLAEIVHDLEQFIDEAGAKEGTAKDAAYSPEEALFHRAIQALTCERVQTLGILPKASDSHDDVIARPILISLALSADDARTKDELHSCFCAHKDNPQLINADIRLLVLKNEIKNFGAQDVFDRFFELHNTTSDALFKHDLRAALCATKEASQIETILRAFTSSDVIKPQDLRMWFATLLANPQAEEAAWTWLQDNWDWLEKTVGGDMEFTNFVKCAAQVFHSAERLKEFRAFFDPKRGVSGLGREIEMDTTLIEGKVALVAAEKEAVITALTELSSRASH